MKKFEIKLTTTQEVQATLAALHTYAELLMDNVAKVDPTQVYGLQQQVEIVGNLAQKIAFEFETAGKPTTPIGFI